MRRSLVLRRGMCAAAAGKAGKSSSEASKQKKSIAATLHLPKTTFPLKADVQKQATPEALERLTTAAYRRQWRSNAPSSPSRTAAGKAPSSSSRTAFTLLDGPPFANGQLHAGHFQNKVLKDALVRYNVALGKQARFVPGFDCHGLPIELMSLKAAMSDQKKAAKGGGGAPLGDGAVDIRARCRAFAESTLKVQARDFQSWGVMADWDTSYTTMDKTFEAREARVLKRMMEKGLVYRGIKPVHWSPASQTALAEAELEYKDDHKSVSVHALFPCVNASDVIPLKGLENLNLVAWTTTPWSLSANRALAVNVGADYVAAKFNQGTFVVAKDLLDAFAKHMQQAAESIVAELKGSELIGLQCHSALFGNERTVKVIAGDHVTTDSGTGIVHIAPVHGMEDWDCFRKAFPDADSTDLRLDMRINERGVFYDFNEAHLRDALEGKKALAEGNAQVVDLLQKSGRLAGHAKEFVHKYPYDWRTKTPLMTRATAQFFIRISDEVADEAKNVIENELRFVPAQSKARLLSTLLSRKEWCISRQRVWGLPIPFYTRGDDVLFSPELVDRFAARCEAEGSDFWYKSEGGDESDDVLPAEERGKGWRRGRDTLDVWFDSGCAWYASNPDFKENDRPYDAVVEGSDQHRGWFQSSLLTRVIFENKAPFTTIVSHGFVLDDKMQKMSKSLGNVLVPKDAIAKAGSVDAVRLWACLSDSTSDVALGPTTLATASDAMRKLRNVLRYLLSVCENENKMELETSHPMDALLLAELDQVISQCLSGLDKASIRGALKPVVDFLSGDLMTVYIEQSKDRLYCESKASRTRVGCVETLRTVLLHLTPLLAPVLVFTCDDLLTHGPRTFGSLPDPSSLRISTSLPLTMDESKQKTIGALLDARQAINRLLIKDEDRGRAIIRLTVGDDTNLASLQWMNADQGTQWTPLAEALQVRRLDLAKGSSGSPIEAKLEKLAEGCDKCERCRKCHESVKARPTGPAEEAAICDRCLAAHQTATST